MTSWICLNKRENMIIAVDFDGTCVKHEYPDVGEDCPNAVDVLRRLSEKHQLILYTMRSGVYLTHAVQWFHVNKIPLSGIQYSPGQTDWTSSNKCYAQLYIDDAAFGAPLITGDHSRPYINWEAVRDVLLD